MAASPASGTLTPNLTLTVGRLYNLAFTIASQHAGTTLATPATGVGVQTLNVNVTPTLASNTYRFLWTCPTKLGSSGNGDIAVSAPTGTGCRPLSPAVGPAPRRPPTGRAW